MRHTKGVTKLCDSDTTVSH